MLVRLPQSVDSESLFAKLRRSMPCAARVHFLSWSLLLLSAGAARAEAPGEAPPDGPRPITAEALTDAEFALVRSEGSRRFWMSRETVTTPKRKGKVQLLDDSSAFARVSTRALPAALAALSGAVVRLESARGDACEVKLERWGVFAEFNPVPDGLDEAEREPQRLANLAYTTDETAELRYAVDITQSTQSCTDALWARLASLPQVASYAVRELEGAAREPVRKLLRATSAFREAQERYREAQRGSWDRHRDTGFSAFACELGTTRHLIGNLHYFEDCESFAADVVGFFVARGKSHREQANELSTPFEPLRAIDLNMDGFPEWVSQYHLVAWDGEHMARLRSVEPENWFCPC